MISSIGTGDFDVRTGGFGETVSSREPEPLDLRSWRNWANAQMGVQVLLLSKNEFKTRKSVEAWLRRYNYVTDGIIAVSKPEKVWRARQLPESDFLPDTLVTMRLANGIQAVYGYLKPGKYVTPRFTLEGGFPRREITAEVPRRTVTYQDNADSWALPKDNGDRPKRKPVPVEPADRPRRVRPQD
jgi:hypothetical protein